MPPTTRCHWTLQGHQATTIKQTFRICVEPAVCSWVTTACRLLYVHFIIDECARGFRGSEARERVTEAHVSLLLHVGLLTRHSVPDRFLFAVPNAGPIVKGIIAGRKASFLFPLPSLLPQECRSVASWFGSM